MKGMALQGHPLRISLLPGEADAEAIQPA